MMVKPWARAIAAMPGRPTPSPTTAAVPAPMNTNEKVPMNSARSLAVIRLDILDSRDEMTARRDQVCAKERYVWLGVADGTGERRRPAKRAGLLRGDRLRFEIDAQRLRDAGAVCGIGSIEVNELALDNLEWHAVHRRLEVVKQLLLLIGAPQPDQVSRLPIVLVAVPMIVAGRDAHDLERRLAVAVVPERTTERVRLVEGVRVRFAL